MLQWTGCLGVERRGGDRSCCSGQGVMVWRDVEVTEVVAMDRHHVG